MRLYFVMGVPTSGKSTYIKEHFSDKICFDLWDYQSKNCSYAAIYRSYEECLADVIKQIKYNEEYNIDEDIVLEHTMLKANRRKWYVSKIREVSDIPIEVILINPPKKILIKRAKSRGLAMPDTYIENNLSALEKPSLEEGFDKVTIEDSFSEDENYFYDLMREEEYMNEGRDYDLRQEKYAEECWWGEY